MSCFFFFQAEDGIRDWSVTGVQTCALPIYRRRRLAPRPGKAPRAVVERVVGADAVLEEAMDHLVQRAYRDALVEQQILPLTQAEVKVEQGEEGKPVIFTATVPIRPEVRIGDYRGFNLKPDIETNDEA